MQLQPRFLYQIPNNDTGFSPFLISNGNRNEWSTIQGVIGRVIPNFQFEMTRSYYQLIVSITRCENHSLGIFINVDQLVSSISIFQLKLLFTWSLFFIDFD